ncbi:MAG TPA: transcriptional repressor [Kofleriaceae bacterium]|nr:transcriptional repressor [Kofleriaceae bacterium]
MTHDQFRIAIRRVGLRATLQRIAVLRVLSDSATPLSHGEVSERLSVVAEDRSTIYRNLIDLARVGLVRRVTAGHRGWRFELARGVQHARAHPHFVCTSCGKLSCLVELRVVARRVKTPRAVPLGQFEVQVRGICDACATTAGARSPDQQK